MNFPRERVDSFYELTGDWPILILQNQLMRKILRTNSPCLQRFFTLCGQGDEAGACGRQSCSASINHQPRSDVGVTRMATEYSRLNCSGVMPSSWMPVRYLVR